MLLDYTVLKFVSVLAVFCVLFVDGLVQAHSVEHAAQRRDLRDAFESHRARCTLAAHRQPDSSAHAGQSPASSRGQGDLGERNVPRLTMDVVRQPEADQDL